jgi:uncharacterized protein (TIRG00374 family)
VDSPCTRFWPANMGSQEKKQFMKFLSGTGEKASGGKQRSSSAFRRWGLRGWQLWVGLAFSLGFLVLALRKVDFTETANAISRANILILAVACLSYMLSVAAKAARWQLLLSAHKTPSFSRAFSIFSVGQMMNAFLPAHLGEFARAYLMGEAEADSKVYILGTVVVERLADLLFLLISIALLLSQMVFPNWLATPARDASLGLAILVPCLILLTWQRNLIMRIVTWLCQFAPSKWGKWLVQQAHFGLSSLDAVRSPRLLAGLFTWSTIICVVSTLTNYLVFWALGVKLSIWSSLFLLVVLQLGTAIPSSPGRIGVFQYLVILSLSIFILDKNLALGYSVLLYLVVYVPLAIIGIYCLWREKITWHTLEEAAAKLKSLRSRTI